MKTETIIESYTNVLKNYANFSGKSSRKDYWYFVLANLIITIAVSIIAKITGLGILPQFYSLFVLLPGLAVSVRRLHDIGKSGWMLLVSLIPLIGFIWLIILMATKGESSKSKSGKNAKAI